ncbi:MAG: hypothetical protein CMJ34_14970, partial [Phycisphaerae bacterium]|nr:hypothetical protein [Phycisphaerae bacterium]
MRHRHDFTEGFGGRFQPRGFTPGRPLMQNGYNTFGYGPFMNQYCGDNGSFGTPCPTEYANWNTPYFGGHTNGWNTPYFGGFTNGWNTPYFGGFTNGWNTPYFGG